ncbi:MAG: hypothetical protein MZV65_43740, partial [Chromatiales bacterium]|nr:hypothetical protein [Chromatiales bacterium]
MVQLDSLELPDLTWLDPFETQAVSVVSRRRLQWRPDHLSARARRRASDHAGGTCRSAAHVR